ncbi:MAG: hypothetical protein H6684_10115 [Deltaproteobacteria bacterium]|nr:hypothetical protein [Deltaproteobacteria bacterium]
MSQTHNGASARQILESPFDPNLIKSRPGSFGEQLSYVEGAEYIRRLNEAFDGRWSFEVITHETTDRECIVVGKLVAEGFVKMAFGGTEIKRKRETGEVVCLADDLKAAATDALKKAASFLGVGLHLYSDAPTNGTAHNPTNGANGHAAPTNGSNGSSNGSGGRLTARQLSAILSIGKDKGLDRGQINKLCLERFGKNLEFLSKAEASLLISEK